jgi:hypothetical protein
MFGSESGINSDLKGNFCSLEPIEIDFKQTLSVNQFMPDGKIRKGLDFNRTEFSFLNGRHNGTIFAMVNSIKISKGSKWKLESHLIEFQSDEARTRFVKIAEKILASCTDRSRLTATQL